VIQKVATKVDRIPKENRANAKCLEGFPRWADVMYNQMHPQFKARGGEDGKTTKL